MLKIGAFQLESQTNSHNGMDFEISPTPSRATIIQTMGTIRRNLKHQLVIINARFDALKQKLPPFLRGHAQARSRLMPFLHYSEESQILKLEQSQSISYLGLNPVNYCRGILNTWRNAVASVGLDYFDSSALWAMVLFWSRFHRAANGCELG
jgi:hypothetical protein